MIHTQHADTRKEALAFDRVVVVVNPNSTRGQQVKHQVQELHDVFGSQVHTIETSQNLQRTRECLRQILRIGDAVTIAGGDGTVHDVVTELSTGEFCGQKIPILPLWGGNGNDLAHMLNGRPSSHTPSQILQTGNVVAIYPLQGHMTDEYGTRTSIGANYIGLGGTAATAARLNAPTYRNLPMYHNRTIRQCYEAATSLYTLINTPPFQIEEDGLYKSVFERTIANGERMAKYGRPPVQITERRAFVSDIAEKQFQTVTKWAAQLSCPTICSPPSGTYLEEGMDLRFRICEAPVDIHFDAEPEILIPDTEVLIGHAQEPFYAISTKYRT